MEAGDPKRFWQRFKVSVLGASTASLFAAAIFELIRTTLGAMPAEFKAVEDPLGFSILGLLLGLTFSITNSPSYLGALRAGTGFEYTGPNYEDIDPNQKTVNKTFPYIDKSILKFVNDGKSYEIEEGLSIQLPGTGTVRIGSDVNQSHIYIPGLSLDVANLVLKNRDAILEPDPMAFKYIEINGRRLDSDKEIRLKHNYVLTFYPEKQHGNKEQKIYRFVYYNRFLDPQA
jgi:hypothetical protein